MCFCRAVASSGGEVLAPGPDALRGIAPLPSAVPGTLLVAPGPLYEGFFVARIRKVKPGAKGKR